jgi:hypothetical protein
MFWLTPSHSPYVNVARIGLVGSAIAGFFLFSAPYYFPGGANHFMLYADALASGAVLDPHLAQRDVGFPLLLLLSGYTLTGSFIPITLIHALFSILIPLLIYLSIQQVSRPVAYYTGLFVAVLLAPILFMKWIHHDQAYVFFSILTLATVTLFVQTRHYRYLYLLTVAASMTSLTRPAGGLIVPLVLTIAYAIGPRRLRHYVICIGIFVATIAINQWHRYEIFNMREGTYFPSYTGQQIFYNLYINSKEFGVQLSPELGPNMAKITDSLFKLTQPSLRESRFIYGYAGNFRPPNDFMEEHIYAFTPETFIKRVYEVPNWEYYTLLCDAERNDQLFLGASWEIVRANPFYVIQYGARNLALMLFRPGYAHSRFNVNPLSRLGLAFPPAGGAVHETTGVSPRAISELQFEPLLRQPGLVQTLFVGAGALWQRSYHLVVNVSSVLMIAAWAALAALLACRIKPSSSICAWMTSLSTVEFAGPLIAASALLAYSLLIVSLFAEPDYRYHHFVLLLRFFIAGYGAIVVVRLLPLLLGSRIPRFSGTVTKPPQSQDATAQRRSNRTAILALVVFISLLFSLWTWFMLTHTP